MTGSFIKIMNQEWEQIWGERWERCVHLTPGTYLGVEQVGYESEIQKRDKRKWKRFKNRSLKIVSSCSHVYPADVFCLDLCDIVFRLELGENHGKIKKLH